jgi:putative transposase
MGNQSEICRKTCRRRNIPGQAHYLTFSCFRRQPFLLGKLAPVWLADSIEKAKQCFPFDLWAYVFMPEHVHLLLLPHPEVEISNILKQIKQPVSIKAIQYVKKHDPEFLDRMTDAQPNGRSVFRFWQRGGGYDRNLWNLENIHTIIRYIHQNPIGRGLVSSPDDWLWSSFSAWEYGTDTPLSIDRESLSQLSPNYPLRHF